MSTPKSVIKLKGKGDGFHVEYESNVDAVKYEMFELSRAALRDVGKFVVRAFREEYYQHFTKRTGNAGKATKYKVWSSKSTKFPRVQIGLKTGKVEGFYAYFQEFGTKRTRKLGLLTNTVQSNIAQIVKIESQYLSYLSEEASKLEGLVNDLEEYEGDAEK